MNIEYPILDPVSLQPSQTGLRYKQTTEDSGSVILELCYDHRINLVHDSVNNQIVATIYNYDGTVATNYTTPITFNYEGNVVTNTPSNGIAAISFTSTVSGDHVINTTQQNCSNGSVTVHV